MDQPHVRVAMTTNNLLQVDANFVAAKQVVFYDVAKDSHEFVDVLHFQRNGLAKKGPGGGKGCAMDDMEDDDGTGHDPLVDRVSALEGCSMVFTLGLSDVAAVRIHSLKVFPVKSEKTRFIDEVIQSIQTQLKSVAPPLWLRRVMLGADGKRMIIPDQQTI